MTIAVGDRIPDVKVFTFSDNGPEATTSAEVLGHGKVVLFGVPGAFTPTCSDHRVPGSSWTSRSVPEEVRRRKRESRRRRVRTARVVARIRA